jgi:hypothetical protein
VSVEFFAQSADGLLFAANGIDPVLIWDGLAGQMDVAGVAAPAAALTFAGAGSGAITGTYYAYTRYVDARGNASDLSPLAGPVTLAARGEVAYSNVPAPAESKVALRQILRNTAGQTQVFYVDVETDDLTSTSFSSTLADGLLQNQEAVALYDDAGIVVANRNAPPPADKGVIAAHLDRMFLAGEEVYREGSVAVTLGSKVVSGVGTAWPATLAGRFLWVAGADRAYEIDAVDVVLQTLTLLEEYGSPSAPYQPYGVRPPLAQRRLVAFSEPGLPESWPAANALSVQEDGDDVVGLMPMGSFLYILERRHVYRLTFQEDPIDDGYVFLSCNRGCVNGRCFAVVDEAAYLLDEAGVYVFSGSRQTEPVSAPIQDLFDPANARARYRLRFESSRWWHCVYDRGTQVVRWFVTLSGTGAPRHALALDLATRRWWVEEYPVPIGASCVGLLDGERRVFLGGPGGQVFLLGPDSLDLVDARRGKVRGLVTSATPTSLTDAQGRFGDDLAGAPVTVVSGRGRGQQRVVVQASAARLDLDRPWSVRPDPTSTYQVGGVRWRYRTGWFRWAPAEVEGPRRIEILFEPCAGEQTLLAYFYADRSGGPVVWRSDYGPSQLNSLGTERGDAAMTGDLSAPGGWMQRRMDGHKELYIDGQRLFSWELQGVTNGDPAVIYQVTLDGAVGGGRGE